MSVLKSPPPGLVLRAPSPPRYTSAPLMAVSTRPPGALCDLRIYRFNLPHISSTTTAFPFPPFNRERFQGHGAFRVTALSGSRRFQGRGTINPCAQCSFVPRAAGVATLVLTSAVWCRFVFKTLQSRACHHQALLPVQGWPSGVGCCLFANVGRCGRALCATRRFHIG